MGGEEIEHASIVSERDELAPPREFRILIV